jgi:hypothetical protein
MLAVLLSSSVFSQTNKGIINFPYFEGFENNNNYQLSRQIYSGIKTVEEAANTGIYGLMFCGSNQTRDWVDSAGVTTSLNAWEANFRNISSVTINVDATNISNLILKLDLKQTYGRHPKDCWFRVLANGRVIKDNSGMKNFNPATHNEVFTRKTFDLSTLTIGKIKLTLQSCCYSAQDRVFIDNISLDNPNNVTIIESSY